MSNLEKKQKASKQTNKNIQKKPNKQTQMLQSIAALDSMKHIPNISVDFTKIPVKQILGNEMYLPENNLNKIF